MIRARLALLAGLVAIPALAAPVPASALLIREATPSLDYRWTLPAEAALAPDLVARLRARAAADRAKARAAAAADAAMARGDGRPARRHVVWTRWSAAAETPALLAFAGEVYAFTGGAHGNSGAPALIWDRRAGREIAWRDLFADAAAAETLLRAAYCPALDRARAEKRGGQTLTTPDFNACPPFRDLALLPVGRDLIAAIRVTADPYVAGPYAEGGYVVELPLTATLLRLLKPRYRDAFVGG